MHERRSPPPADNLVNDELEVGFDARFEAAWARIERVGRAGFAVIVLAGLAGALGAGPLDHRRVGDPHAPGGAVDFQPVGRFGTATQITIHLPPGPPGRETVVHLSGTFVEPLGAQDSIPRPLREAAETGGIAATFVSAGEAGSLVRLDGKPTRIGPIALWVRLGDAPALHFTEFVLP